MARDGPPGPRLHDEPQGAAGALPAVRALRAVQSLLRSRGGTNSWALIDTWGRLHGFEPQRVYVSASLVKAMLLVAYLREIGNRAPDAGERASLGPMITVSSNDAADTIYYRVGDAALYRLARLAGMRRFSVAGYWGERPLQRRGPGALLQPHRQARAEGLARVRAQAAVVDRRATSAGASRATRSAAGFKTFFKGGWRGTGAGQLVHEAALFERGDTRVSMAVLTDGNPSHEYGTETLRGVAQRLFRRRAGAPRPTAAPRRPARPPRAAPGWSDVHRFGPGIRVNLSYRTKHNETGAPLPGYCENWALMHERGRVQPRPGAALPAPPRPRPPDPGRLPPGARHRGARPLGGAHRARRPRGHLHRAPQPPQHRAARWTSRWSAIRDGKRLRMGGFDLRAELAHLQRSGRILRNRLTLKSAMERFGFSAYLNEWWHFEHHIRPNRYLDVTLGLPGSP